MGLTYLVIIGALIIFNTISLLFYYIKIQQKYDDYFDE